MNTIQIIIFIIFLLSGVLHLFLKLKIRSYLIKNYQGKINIIGNKKADLFAMTFAKGFAFRFMIDIFSGKYNFDKNLKRNIFYYKVFTIISIVSVIALFISLLIPIMFA